MDYKRKLMIVTVIAACFFVNGCSFINKTGRGPLKNTPERAKNIIFMVPDGQGLSDVVAARIFKNGPDGAPLYQETLENIGYQRTFSANSTVTDSAAAASAWAIGQKFNNGEISCHAGENGECIDKIPTILELAGRKGRATGLVATSQISHATPAAFGAHVFSRGCGAEIARQYIEESGVDVILGGSLYGTKGSCSVYTESFKPADKRKYIIDLAGANNYTFVTDKAGLKSAVSGSSKKLLGMFEQNGAGNGKTVEMFRIDPSAGYPEDEPLLKDMTEAALDILEKDREGFFLLVEGSQVDWENHNNNVRGQIAESLGFDAAVKAVLDWINEKPGRKEKTLLIVVADHDCGGFAVNGPYGGISKAGDIVEAGWTSGSHTAVDTIIYSQGPGSKRLNAAVDNTFLYQVMKDAMD